MKETILLGIETSCDETACAIVQDAKTVLSNVVATQIDVHKQYGGVFPEIASRIHVENISMVIETALEKANIALEDVDAIAVTEGPGLIGSLHVGVQAAKTLALISNKPLVPVHHIAGHIHANDLVADLRYPLIAIVVSGGHTELVYMEDEWSYQILGSTQDDAIGEAGDKVGRVLGLAYPGGVYLDQLAKTGKPVYKLAKPHTDAPLDFSYSGLKSSVIQFIQRCQRQNVEYDKADLAASYQAAAFGALLERVEQAIELYHPKQMVLAGGVAANSYLRSQIQDVYALRYPDVEFILPPLWCCTDNAAMIAAAGYYAYRHGVRGDYSLTAKASLKLDNCVK